VNFFPDCTNSIREYVKEMEASLKAETVCISRKLSAKEQQKKQNATTRRIWPESCKTKKRNGKTG
jgi:hypothetical protein